MGQMIPAFTLGQLARAKGECLLLLSLVNLAAWEMLDIRNSSAGPERVAETRIRSTVGEGSFRFQPATHKTMRFRAFQLGTKHTNAMRLFRCLRQSPRGNRTFPADGTVKRGTLRLPATLDQL